MILAIIAAAAAAANPADLPALTRPDWISKPTGEDVGREYPQKAMRIEMGGNATVQCEISPAGSTTNCSVLEERPANFGFGEAALQLSKKFRLAATSPSGESLIGRRVVIPVGFYIPKNGDTTPPSVVRERASACYGQVAKLAEEDPFSDAAWSATLYWAVRLGAAEMLAYGRPSKVEISEREARLAAQAGTLTPPNGADLKSCMDAAAKR